MILSYCSTLVNQKIITGFMGKNPNDQGVIDICDLISKKYLGGVILFGHNIESCNQVKDLISHLKAAAPKQYPLLVCIDQEGGKVQRLKAEHGLQETMSAQDIASTLTPPQAYEIYKTQAKALKELGFNYNFAPVTDLKGICPVIGSLKRAYSPDPKIVCAYVKSHFKAYDEVGIYTSIKHFPGHGFASGDTHKGFVDITDTFQETELKPFQMLIEAKTVHSIMVAHLTNKNIDESFPSSLSSHFVPKMLRENQNYDGIVVSDDYSMGAILEKFDRLTVLNQAIKADVDLMIFSGNPLAMGDHTQASADFSFDKLSEDLEKLYVSDQTLKGLIDTSLERVKKFKNKL